MRFRAVDRPTLTAASALTLFALALMGRLIPGLVVPSEPVPVEDRGRAETESDVRKNASRLRALDPTLRSEWLRLSEGIRYEGTGRNIFEVERGLSKISPGPGPTRPKLLPSIGSSLLTTRLRFFGFANITGEAKRVFLSNDSDLFIGEEGEIVNGRYRILQVTPSSVELEDLINGIRQKLLLDQG